MSKNKMVNDKDDERIIRSAEYVDRVSNISTPETPEKPVEPAPKVNSSDEAE